MRLFGIRGLRFSWREFFGISSLKRKIGKATGVPTTKSGFERKVGRSFLAGLSSLFGGDSSVKATANSRKNRSPVSRAAAEFAALQNLSKGKKADLTHITNPAYVTKPPLTADINAVPEDYTPQLTELGKQRLEEYIRTKYRL